MSVMHWGKHNISKALNSTKIFAVCRGGLIWSMIDIKCRLRIGVQKFVRLCKLTLSFITALAPIDLLGYFKSGFGLESPLFLRSLCCCDSSYPRAAVMRERIWETALRGEINLHLKYWSHIIGQFLNNKCVAYPLVLKYKINRFLPTQICWKRCIVTQMPTCIRCTLFKPMHCIVNFFCRCTEQIGESSHP